MRRIIAAALMGLWLVVSAAPAAEQVDVFGIVLRGPVTPVCREGVPCEAPAARVAVVFVRAGTSVRVVTASNGRFRVALPPGRYGVRLARSAPLQHIVPRVVVVRGDAPTLLRLVIDTGIRAPGADRSSA